MRFLIAILFLSASAYAADVDVDKMAQLDAALKAVCPVDGFSANGRTITKIDFKPESTTQQRADAQAVVLAFDWDKETLGTTQRKSDIQDITVILAKPDADISADEFRALMLRLARRWLLETKN